MFQHEKMLFHPVAAEKPNPHYAALLQEQLGHMEMVAQTINLLNGHDVDAGAVPAGEIPPSFK